jgi:hypothetical protein
MQFDINSWDVQELLSHIKINVKFPMVTWVKHESLSHRYLDVYEIVFLYLHYYVLLSSNQIGKILLGCFIKI